MVLSLYYRYFIYSTYEEELKIKIHGANAPFGTVMVNGVPKRYTSIVRNPANAPADGLVVQKGDIRRIKYTPPSK